jgi:hypothetical protein
MSQRPSNSETEIVELIRSIDEPAPERLRRHVAELTARTPSPRRGVGGLLAASPVPFRLGAAAATLAVALAAVVIALSGGSSSGPTLKDEMAMTLRTATLPAPAESRNASDQLNVSVDGIAFPYWGERFGWKTSGARRDVVDGRTIQTVFYTAPGGGRIGYAIVSGTPASVAEGGTVRWRGKTPYRLLEEGGVSVVTWVRNGHRCVVAGRGVSADTLLRLASWDEDAPSAA